MSKTKMTPQMQETIARLKTAAAKSKELHPMDYARMKVHTPPDERGYRMACVRAVAAALRVTPETVKRWGTDMEHCPRHYWAILYDIATLEKVFDAIARHPSAQIAILTQLIQ